MPRALRGRFEPVDHFVLGHLSILGPLSALGSPHAAKRFIGLAIVVRGKDRVKLSPARQGWGRRAGACHDARGAVGRVMTKLTNAAALRSARWKGRQQGFSYSWAVSTYRTPRDV